MWLSTATSLHEHCQVVLMALYMSVNHRDGISYMVDWLIEHDLTSAPTQYRLYGRLFLQVKRRNHQYQSTEGDPTKDKANNENNKIHICTDNNRHKKDIHKISTTSPLVYTNMGLLGDGSHRGQVRQAWTAVGLPPRYPQHHTWMAIQRSNVVHRDNKPLQ